MYLGRIIRLQLRDEYIKATIGAEVGYETKYVIVRTPNKLMFDGLEERDQVIYTGYNIQKDNKIIFKLESIIKRNFEACAECELPKTAKKCLLNHSKKEAQKLDGTWKVVHKIVNDSTIKIFFDKCNFVFAGVATPQHWYHDIFNDLAVGEMVEVEGWRYKAKTSLRYLKRV